MRKSSIKQRLLDLHEAAQYLGRSEYSMRSLVWQGEVPIVKSPGARKQWFDLQDLDLFIERNKVVNQ